ncbi:hypothetical protein B11Cv2_011360 [Bartonella sp. 1-1C]|nr:hypothetical protein B11Cv2_011360 [Bartonella sp. 1-1C]
MEIEEGKITIYGFLKNDCLILGLWVEVLFFDKKMMNPPTNENLR